MHEGFKIVLDFSPKQNTLEGLTKRAEKRMDAAHKEADDTVAAALMLFSESRNILDADCKSLINGKKTAAEIADKWRKQHIEDAEEYGYNPFIFDELSLQNVSSTEAMLIACNVRRYSCGWQYAAFLTGLLYFLTENSFYQQIYDIQVETGAAFQFQSVDSDMAISELFSRNDYLSNLAEQLSSVFHDNLFETYEQALIDGSLSNHKHDLDEVEDNAGYAISRQVHTEATIDVAEAQAKACEQYGIERYKYLTEHDDRVCPVCAVLDQKIFLFKDRNTGVNYPPIHPNCRCQTVSYLTVKDLDYFKNHSEIVPFSPMTVPEGMTYDDWLKSWGIYLTEVMED